MTGSPDEAEVLAVAAEIENYLHGHPRSADNLAGIRSWWLPPDTQTTLATVDMAVRRLIERRLLVLEVLPDGGVIFASSQDPPDAHEL